MKNNKKILLLIPQNVIPSTDGGKASIYYPMKFLAENFIVKAIVFISDKEIENPQDYKYIDVEPEFIRIDKSDRVFTIFKNIFKKLPFKFSRYYNSHAINNVLSICNIWQPDIVICHHAHLGYYGKIFRTYFPKVKIILREHNIEYLIVEQFARFNNNLLIKLVAYWQFLKTKKCEIASWAFFNNVLFISNSDLIEAEKYIKDDKYFLLPDGSNLVKINICDKKNVILFIGSLSALQNQYNFNFFIKTIWIPFCDNQKVNDFELWVTGNTDSFFELKSGLSKTQQVKYKIKVLGFVDNISEIIQSAKYFLSPTIIGAGIRLKVLEAACNGAVIFLTKVDFEMLPSFRDMQNVVLYDDYKSFIEKFSILENDNQKYEIIQKNIYEFATINLTWDIFYKKYIEIITK